MLLRRRSYRVAGAMDDVVVNRARLMNRTTWDDNYTAKKIVTYFKEGYKLAD